MYYIVENIRGYIKKPTFIFDEYCDFLYDAYKFNEKTLKKFFIFRNKKNYKIYLMGANNDTRKHIQRARKITK